MVGHTGVMKAAMEAVKTVDDCVGQVVDAILDKGGKCIITADHGNADQMIDYRPRRPLHGAYHQPRARDRHRSRRIPRRPCVRAAGCAICAPPCWT